MRISSFVVGGVIGMVGAVYLMQRKPGAVNAVNNMMSDVKNNMVNKAANFYGDSVFAKASKQEASTNDHSHGKQQDHDSNESLIKDIIESDPKLQSEFNEITNGSQSVKH